MSRSQNGWSAAPGLAIRPLVVNGIAFLPGIRDDDDVETVLRYVIEQYAARVEPLRNPGCWGFNYRENRNDPNSLSNHSSGTAVDVNAPAHPNGVPTLQTFTVAQATEIHRILAEVDDVVRWGGDYSSTPDAMHFEINADAAAVARVADRLRGEDMPLSDEDLQKIDDIVKARVEAAFAKEQKNGKTLRENVLAIAAKLGVKAKP